MKLDTMLRNEMLHIAGQTYVCAYVHVEIGDYSLSLSLIPLPELVSLCLFISFASQSSSQAFSSSFSLLLVASTQSFSHYACILENI